MTAIPRPIEQLVRDRSPLKGAEQQVLREWIAEWRFHAAEFTSLAQPLVRGDLEALQRDHRELQATHGAHQATERYESMRETPLRMPAMEVVIAGAQYFNSCRGEAGEYEGCLRYLAEMGVSVDGEDVAGFTAFMRASQTSQSRMDLAQVLLDLGADVNHRSRFGGVALHEALMAQDRKAVAFLRRNGAEMDIRDYDGVSPRDIVALIL
ncbi:hypothetical protein LPJ56_003294 [Coemansia sp. RSA 2599]|nr:hypothetical protein LPJ75_003045 [Coemansia sp. RSA 2598]KAJ1821185.1 hypothetical protein LPJ56_003294 [Coemansia sp. RSA 2599]